MMHRTVLSTSNQIEIPREILEKSNISPGTEFTIFELNGKIELLPVKPIAEYFGVLSGISTDISREDIDRI